MLNNLLIQKAMRRECHRLVLQQKHQKVELNSKSEVGKTDMEVLRSGTQDQLKQLCFDRIEKFKKPAEKAETSRQPQICQSPSVFVPSKTRSTKVRSKNIEVARRLEMRNGALKPGPREEKIIVENLRKQKPVDSARNSLESRFFHFKRKQPIIDYAKI